MKRLERITELYPELQDQINLLKNVITKERCLSPENIKLVAWATATASQNKALIELVKSTVGELSSEEKRIVVISSSRMAITNPYYMSRNIAPLNSGGTLHALGMRPFQDFKIGNETGYHYACIAVSSVNNGLVCFSSHINSLKTHAQNDDAIDQALRITSALLAAKQIMANGDLACFS